MIVADLFSALADPTRLRVLEMLHERARPVHELAGAFDISRPAISRHLRVLKEAGLVREVKKGRENVYSLVVRKLEPATDWLERHKAGGIEPPKAVRPAKKKAARTVVEQAKPARPEKQAEVTKSAAPPPSTPQLSFFDL